MNSRVKTVEVRKRWIGEAIGKGTSAKLGQRMGRVCAGQGGRVTESDGEFSHKEGKA